MPAITSPPREGTGQAIHLFIKLCTISVPGAELGEVRDWPYLASSSSSMCAKMFASFTATAVVNVVVVAAIVAAVAAALAAAVGIAPQLCSAVHKVSRVENAEAAAAAAQRMP